MKIKDGIFTCGHCNNDVDKKAIEYMADNIVICPECLIVQKLVEEKQNE